MSTRRYPVLEALVGMSVPAKMPAKKSAKKQGMAKRLEAPRALPVHAKFQQLIEKTVKTLLLTSSADGDLTFRADVDAGVMADLSLDVMLVGRELVITFYTQDTNVRRLLQGYERDLDAHLRARGLRVKKIVFATTAADTNGIVLR